MLPIYWMYHKKNLTRLLLLWAGFLVGTLVPIYLMIDYSYKHQNDGSGIADVLAVLIVVEWLGLLTCVIVDNNLFYKHNMNWLYHIPVSRGKFILNHLGMVLLQLLEITVLSVTTFFIVLLLSFWMKFDLLDTLKGGCTLHLMYEIPTTKEYCPALVLNNGILRSYDYDEKSKRVIEYKWSTEKASEKILNKFDQSFGEGLKEFRRPMCNLITLNGGRTKQVTISSNEKNSNFLMDPLSNARNLSLFMFLMAIIIYNLLSFNGIVTNLKNISSSTVYKNRKLPKSYVVVIGLFIFMGGSILSFIGDLPLLGFTLPLITGILIYALVIDYRITWKIPIIVNSRISITNNRFFPIFIVFLPSIFFIVFGYIHARNPAIDGENLLAEMKFLKSFTPKLTNEQIKKIIALKDLDYNDIDLLKKHLPVPTKNNLLTIFHTNTAIDDLVDVIINKTDIYDAPRIIGLFSNSLTDKDRFLIFNKIDELAKHKKLPSRWSRWLGDRYDHMPSILLSSLFPRKKYQNEDIEKLILNEHYEAEGSALWNSYLYSSSPIYLANIIVNNLEKFKSISLKELENTLSFLYLKKISINDLMSEKRTLLGKKAAELNLEYFCKGITASTIGKVIDTATDENVGMIYYCNNQLYINNVSFDDEDKEEKDRKKRYVPITSFSTLVYDHKKQKNVLPENIKMILIKNFK
ncbi:MAG: hypothetical protein HQK53_11330 [Oligoflexia bacterium]|nr:hypothetical protein [Oligoflexia bacterium]